jgi:N-acyl-D-aspartate/D-glutamate deacylase
MFDTIISNARIVDGSGAPWFEADLVLFDPAGVCDRATLENPHVYPQGIDYVWVNGVLTLDQGRHTDRTSGCVLTAEK